VPDDPVEAMNELADPVGADSAGPPRGSWEFLEILATIVLGAESLRVVGAVVSGVIFATTAHVGPFGNQQLVGSAMQAAASFSDGPGIVLLLVSFALVWWRAEYWTKQVGPAAVIQLGRLGFLARWATVLFALAAAGAASFLIGNILVNTAGGVPTSDQWQAYANDTFSVAYLVISLAGLVATRKLAALCARDAANTPG
jgi:hypothetical protein